MKNNRICSGKRIVTALTLALIIIWLIGYRHAFLAEWHSLRAVPFLARLSYAEKNHLIWGTFYNPYRDGLSVVPETGSIYFLNYCPETKRDWQWLLARYYFTPRKIIFSNPGDASKEAAVKSDFAIACICAEMSGTGLEELGFLEQLPFRKVGGNSYLNGTYAIYRIDRTGEGAR
ncbi:MAG: hypothetical protein IT393_01900 [Nitrospirae bacterium]|nr:hypothetical protein [Nitrospirota bacterium]